MADVFTPELNLIKPEVGGSTDTWGEKFNTNMDKVDQFAEDTDALLTKLDGLLVGMVFPYATDTAPAGTMDCDGSAVSRTTYARLFSRIGTLWGEGDGSTTFNLPDLRGEHLRFFDDGRGVDAGRVFAALQMDQNKAHDHGGSTEDDTHTHTGFTDYDTHKHTGTTDNYTHSHTVKADGGSAFVDKAGDDFKFILGDAGHTGSDTHDHDLNINNDTHRHTLEPDDNTHAHDIASDGGSEVRVRNQTLLACIYY